LYVNQTLEAFIIDKPFYESIATNSNSVF